MKLYQYAIIWEPTEDQAKDGKRAEMVVDLTTTLADTDQSATIIAGRAIPEERLAELDQLTVVVRPF